MASIISLMRLLFLISSAVQITAFLPPSLILSQRLSTRLSNSKGADDDEALARARNEARTDVRNLLTQRSIQSFMYLCEECRDPHSGKWIEDFLGTKNQLQFHGTGAGYMESFGGTWDAPLLEMMNKPKDVVVVSAKRRGRGHGGWSKDNPYLEERWVEFEIDIDPPSLTTRILSVREQIAAEWVNDLDVLSQANDNIITSYFSRVRKEREDNYGEEDIPASSDYIRESEVAFERTAVNILNNYTAFATNQASSPFRKGNFDLLYNLCTQASVHRLLRSLAEQGQSEADKRINFAWLRDFYCARVEDFFDGDQPYGRADDFMEELLFTSPSVVYTSDRKPGLADPLGLAESIISIRNDVVHEWKHIMTNVPQDHTELRKVLFDKQMQSWGQKDTYADGFQ
mmetsp:Transcript_65432/g.77454  ORF Transcript_65432/g.77454 Transcript_65432/m.77454 type:complete len:400 (+) Transcript_65432:152-1351(+)|eukprot:CAMPEP_0172511674 /NCGR_PEP_ID=MMETSP1066-20121228/238059_1 /TAXON_ID=671091 /ORGANISM="Coscinodiscus wailesii, Strain CCMP2513" /LENGTH=399 /DNA_ID=CAMNT_0013291143 /DNA_START=139 /DNA_END=1338 /DNA_ORIENTATION=+